MASPAAAAAADGEDLEDAAPPLPMLLATDLRYPVTIVVLDMMARLLCSSSAEDLDLLIREKNISNISEHFLSFFSRPAELVFQENTSQSRAE